MESRKLLNPRPLAPKLESQPSRYVVLNLSFNFLRWDPTLWMKVFTATLLLLTLTITAIVLWPWNPDVQIVRIRTNHVRIHTHPHIAIDVSMDATVRVKNRALYSMDYSSLNVAVGYRGKELGHVVSGGGHVRAKGSSYVDSEMEFNGVELVPELFYLVEDFAKGFIQFDTVTQVDGSFGFSFLKVPLKTKISCEIVVDVKKQTISRQNCNHYKVELEDDTHDASSLAGK